MAGRYGKTPREAVDPLVLRRALQEPKQTGVEGEAGSSQGSFAGTSPIASPTEAPPEPMSPERPEMPPAGGTSATPLGAGTFALPGEAGAMPFRTTEFLTNRNIGGTPERDPRLLGMQPGGAPVESQLPPDELRRIFGRALGGR